MVNHHTELPHTDYFDDVGPVRRGRQTALQSAVAAMFSRRFDRLVNEQRRRGIVIQSDAIEKLRLRRMFVGGAAGAFIASMYTNRHVYSPAFHLLHSEAFALWSNVLITCDVAMDEKHLDYAESLELLTKGLVATVTASSHSREIPEFFRRRYESTFERPLSAGELSFPMSEEYRFENFSLDLVIRLGRVLNQLGAHHDAIGSGAVYRLHVEEFFDRYLDLAAGQLRSFDQSVLDEEHDWGWYLRILNEKSLNVMLAPLAVFAETREDVDKSRELQQCFLLVNRLFFHRQVLDDLLDLQSDTEEGLASTLIYMLISQGRVAKAAATLGNPGILAEIARSGLLLPQTWAWRQWSETYGGDDIRHVKDVSAEGFSMLLRLALANRFRDFEMPIEELVALYRERMARIFELWQTRRCTELLDLVYESGVVERICASIADRRNVEEIEMSLRDLEDQRVKYVFWYFYHRTMRTYRRILDTWGSKRVYNG